MRSERKRRKGIQAYVHIRTYLLTLMLIYLGYGLYMLLGFRPPFFTSHEHFAPFHLLQHEPLATLYYMHFQPPLFNALIALGIAVQQFFQLPQGPVAFFILCIRVLHHAVMWGGLWVLQATLRAAGVRPALYAAAGIAVFLHPTVLMFMTYIFYTYMVYVFSLIAACWLFTGILCRRPAHVAWAVALLGAVCLLYSLYSLYLLLALVLGLALLRIRLRRRDWALIGATLCVVGGVYVKNYLLFDTLNASSWAGNSLAKVAYFKHMPPQERKTRILEGSLSPASSAPPFRCAPVPPNPYHDEACARLRLPCETYGILRSCWGDPGSLTRSGLYLQDALNTLQTDPRYYLSGLTDAFRLAFVPGLVFGKLLYRGEENPAYLPLTSLHPLMSRVKNTAYVPLIVATYFLLIGYGICRMAGVRTQLRVTLPALLAVGYILQNIYTAPLFSQALRVQAYMAVFLLLLLLYIGCGVRMVLQRPARNAAAAKFCALIVGMAYYLLCVSNMMEVDENMRFRFGIDALLIPLLLLFLRDVRRYPRLRRGRA